MQIHISGLKCHQFFMTKEGTRKNQGKYEPELNWDRVKTESEQN